MNPPANWYPDPTGRHDQRYWDGDQWTEHVFTDGIQGVDPLEQATPAADTGTDEDEEEPSEDTGGLFADAGGEDAWQPGHEQPEDVEDVESGEDAEDADAVAPEVETEDVVATLDEVADASPPDANDDTDDDTDDGGAGDPEETGDDATPAAGDMSDAFILAPETASRIVKRRAAEAEQDAAEPGSIDGAEEVAEPEQAEPAGAPEEAEAADTGFAAPPPTGGGAMTDGGDLGLTGDLLGGAFAERSGAGPVALQNSRLLRCSVTPGDAVVARQGTMVAYQGDVSFERQGAGGVTRALKRAATGEGLAMMRADGSGDVFFADGGQHVFLLQLAGGPGLSVNGRNVLAFSAALQWDIQRVKGASLLAGGLFNTTFTGSGWVALVSDGEPVVLHTDEAPTHVDVNALVAWSAGLSTRIVNSVSAKSLVGLGSGEAFQMAFDGAGIVIVQPSEGPLGGAAAT